MASVPANTVIPDLEVWAATLRTIAAEPLELCPSFPAIARRFEAWWQQGCHDRPIFIATANPTPARPINRRLNYLAHPERWFEAKHADMLQLYWVGDAIPNIRVDFGPVLLGGLLGGIMEFGSDTSWTHPFIADDWWNEPSWTIAEDHPLWQLLRELTERVAADARGRYLLCTPDLGGSADVLLNLRGSVGLCLDVLERPEHVRAAVQAIYPSWKQAFTRLYDQTLRYGTGLMHWLQLWSNRPYVVPACDFNYLIGGREFRENFLADIARQAATVGRAVFHLDGPEAARHIDALLELPELQAIQFTPGEGTPSALAWVDMFRKIQARGKSVLVVCPPREVIALSKALAPEGLAIWVGGASTPAELDDLYGRFCDRYGAGR